MNATRSHELLNRHCSQLLLVDVQDKLVATFDPNARQHLTEACRFLGQGAELFKVPVTITEQYPQGLGPTVESLKEFATTRLAKKQFSAFETTGWPAAGETTDDRFQIVVAGIETHVCVQQTVLDLLAAGYQTFVVGDAVAARGRIDHEIALERMSSAGAVITTAESVLFEWCETAEAPEFKQLSALIKNRK